MNLIQNSAIKTLSAAMRSVRAEKSIPYNFGEKHLDYIRRCRDCTVNVAEGAVRAGKTVDNIFAFCKELQNTNDKLHLATASTLGNAKLIIGDCNGFGIEHYFKNQCRWGKYKGNEALIINGASTNFKTRIVIFSGGMLESSFKSIRGNSYGMWIATEINLHADSFIKEAFNRTIAADKRKIFWDLNPDNPKAKIYTEYIDRYRNDSINGKFIGGYNYGHFTIDDNINIPEQRREEIRSQYDTSSVWYKRDILGIRIAADGIIFRGFADDPERYITDSVDAEKITSINIGIDFGGNKSKTVFVATAFLDGFKSLAVVGEHKIRGEKGEVDPQQISDEFISFVKKLYGRFSSHLIKYVWADNENQAVINGLRYACTNARLGVKIMDCRKAPCNERIAALTSLMAQDRFSVLRECTGVIGSLSEQIWDPKITDRDVRLDDGTCDIDTADALEYSFSKFIKIILAEGKVKNEQ
ncbi:MAG: terminase family protein [Oscillospiraceae bacterium]|nr:terminase family protein [Oscillospiraceae bacterium]